MKMGFINETLRSLCVVPIPCLVAPRRGRRGVRVTIGPLELRKCDAQLEHRITWYIVQTSQLPDEISSQYLDRSSGLPQTNHSRDHCLHSSGIAVNSLGLST